MDLISMAEMHQRTAEEPYLPPGFRFHPTDEELAYYLTRKVLFNSFSVRAITEVDLNKCEPWDLPAKAKMGEKEWYFYTLRDRKYPTGMRTNRATEGGYWKATGKDRNVTSSRTSCLVGMKKTLVFYRGRAPKGFKTNWIMHEYRLEGDATSHLRNFKVSNKDSEWVICRIFQKSPAGKKLPNNSSNFREHSNKEEDAGHKPSSSSEGHSSLPPLLEESSRTLVEEGAVESSETSQNDQVPNFSTNNNSVNSFSNWLSNSSNNNREAASDSMINPHTLSSFIAGLDSHSLSKLQGIQQQNHHQQHPHQLPAVPSDISSLKALDQFTRALAGQYSISKCGIRACKVESFSEERSPTQQILSNNNNSSSSNWLSYENGYTPQLLVQQNYGVDTTATQDAATQQQQSSAGEIHTNLYRTLPVDMESLWTYC